MSASSLATEPIAASFKQPGTQPDDASPSLLHRRLELHPRVALRPEPFGALAYHYDSRRLVFLKHPDMVRVVKALDAHPDVAATLTAAGIATERWPAFTAALASLHESEVVRDRAG